MKKFSKTMTKALTVMLALILVFQSVPAEAFAPKIYISDIKIGWSQTSASDAKRQLTELGYTVLDQNLNEGAKTSQTAVIDWLVKDKETGYSYIGYKTTEDKSEAITDIKMMSMNGGYKMIDYAEIYAAQNKEYEKLASELNRAMDSFSKNLKEGSPAAKRAKQTLDLFKVSETNGEKLGDYLLSDERTSDDFLKIVFKESNSVMMMLIYNQIMLGVADYGETNWAMRMGEKLKTPDTELSDTYLTRAGNLSESVYDFYTNYTAAKKRLDKNDGKVDISDEDTEKEADKAEKELINGEEVEDGDTDILWLTAYETLSKYAYGETNVADYLLSVGKEVKDGKDDETVEKDLYYFAKSLTYGQYAIMRINGIAEMVLCFENTEEAFSTGDDNYTQAVKELKEANGGSTLYAITLETEEKFSTQVGLTSDSVRKISAGNLFDQTDESRVDTTEALIPLMTAGCVFLISLGVWFIETGLVSSFLLGGAGTLAAFSAMCAEISAAFVTGAATAGGIVLAASNIGIAAVVIAAAVAAIYFAVKYFVEWVQSEQAYYNPDYDEIPGYMYDALSTNDGKSYRYVEYTAVDDEKNKGADLNCWGGKEWNALYITKDTSAGSPLVLNSASKLFVVKKNDTTKPSYYKALSKFGESTAANTNDNIYTSSAPSIYLYYQTEALRTKEENAEKEEEKEEKEEEKEEDGKTKYISSLILVSSSSETAARTNIKKRSDSYEILNFNFTYFEKSTFTYIGFTTTTDPDKAVTDIRIAYGNGATDSYKYGDSSYACAGSVESISLYYTKYKAAGTAIEADLKASKTMLDTSNGLEPVNLFCGGNAFDFGYARTSEDFEFSDHAYLYFTPKEKYTAENSKKYISGFSFVSVCSSNPQSEKGVEKHKELSRKAVSDYASLLALTKFSDNDLSELPESSESASGTFTQLYYTTTYNPYRAIYDIKTYQAEDNAEMVMDNISSGSQGYSVCEVYEKNENYLGIRSSNAFQDRQDRRVYCYAGSGAGAALSLYYYAKFSDGKSYTRNIPYRGMYVMGPSKNYEPLEYNDVKMTTGSNAVTDDDTWLGVTDFTDTYNESVTNFCAPIANAFDFGRPANETNEYINFCNKYYMYVKRAGRVVDTKLPYIASINVVYSDTENYSEDMCKLQLLAAGGDEIIPFNLASNTGAAWYDENGKVTGSIHDFSVTMDEMAQAYNNAKPGTYDKAAHDTSYENKCGYIRITRTKSKNNALRDIRLYNASKNASELTDGMPSEITRTSKKGTQVTYVSCKGASSSAVKVSGDIYPSFYLVTSTSSYAGEKVPITELNFTTNPIENGYITVLEDQGSSSDPKAYERSWYMHYESPYAKQFTDDEYKAVKANENGEYTAYKGATATTSLKYIDQIEVSVAANRKKAQIELLNLGCTSYVPADMYNGAGDDEVCYIGYHKKAKYTDSYVDIRLMPLTVVDSVEMVDGKVVTKTEFEGYEYELLGDACINGKYLFGRKAQSKDDADKCIVNLYAGHSTSDITPVSSSEKTKINNLKNALNLYSDDLALKTKWNYVLNNTDYKANLSAGFEKSVSAQYLMYATADNTDDNSANLTGSVFSDPIKAVLIIVPIASLIGAVTVILIKKRKKSKNTD